MDVTVLIQDFEALVDRLDGAMYRIGRLQRLAPEGTPAEFWAKYAASAVRFLTQSAEACIAELRREALASEAGRELCDAGRCACSRR